MHKLALDHWHIELSSICALACPRCPRTEAADSLLNRQISLDFLQQQIGAELLSKAKKITFCGNDGDPIYCRDLVDICAWLKEINHDLQIVIVTNGSYKTTDFWQRLAGILDHRDEINWSVDGWDQVSNQQYRINSDWPSIMCGINTFRQHNHDTYGVWAAIAFAFNENHLDQMQDLAQQSGMDLFQVTKSTKFAHHYPDAYQSPDFLQPRNPHWIAAGSRFERELQYLSRRIRPGQELRQIFLQRADDLHNYSQYSGICLIGNKGIFINSQGEFYPCCWTANRYSHNHSWHELASTRFNLNQRSLKEILEDDFWQTDFLKFDSLECRTKCTRERLQDHHHTTEW